MSIVFLAFHVVSLKGIYFTILVVLKHDKISCVSNFVKSYDKYLSDIEIALQWWPVICYVSPIAEK